MIRVSLALLLPLLWVAPAAAEQMDMNMPGMKMPAAVSAQKAKAKTGGKSKQRRVSHASHAKRKVAARPERQTASHDQMPGMTMPPSGGSAANGAPATGPQMRGMNMSHPAGSMAGMVMPPSPAAATANGAAPPNAMPGMNMSGQGGAMAGMTMPAAEPAIPQTPPPPPPPATDHFADRYYDPTVMAAARRHMRMEMGGMRFSKVMTNLLEYQSGSKGGGYRWDGQAWFGGDINRLVFKSEGEGSVKEGLDSGEVQALYSRAVGIYTDLQAGVRQDFAPRGRTYLTLGAQSLFPQWFDVEGALFLSTEGELLARAEGYDDFRLTQRLVLQPRVELNFAAQNTPETRTGSGLSNAELGLRLRYDIRHDFAPYIGVSYDRRLGKTADYVRAAGEDPRSTTFVVGLRAWF